MNNKDIIELLWKSLKGISFGVEKMIKEKQKTTVNSLRFKK